MDLSLTNSMYILVFGLKFFISHQTYCHNKGFSNVGLTHMSRACYYATKDLILSLLNNFILLVC